jgi:signal transduction histidine kinase
MRIAVVSSNQALVDACRVNFGQLCSAEDDIEHCVSSEAPRGCDIYIWDSETIHSLPSAMKSADPSIKIIIVKKSSLSSLRSALPHNDFAFLQSPVSPLSLRVVLESAIARLPLRQSDDESSLRVSVDRDQILQELLETNLRLQEYDQRRTNFLTRAVHDLRVPLMAVQGYSGLLHAGQLGPVNAEQMRILERMQRSLARLSSLVEALMELGSGVQAATKLKRENSSIEGCIQHAMHELLPFVEKKQITLNLEVDPPSGTLLFDSGQLEQVLVNLLDNGCKFTPKRGSITIRARSIAAEEARYVGLTEPTDGYRIDISDSGPGIDSERMDQIFDEHTSYGDSMDRSGAGLGLAICRMIVQAHNGRIWAASGNAGATFSLVLPMVSQQSSSRVSRAAV